MGLSALLLPRSAALCGLLLLAVACERDASTQVPEGARVHVRAATFAEGSHATEAVRAECNIEADLPNFVEKYSRGAATADPGADPSRGRVLELTVTNVMAPGGGAFSGPKQMAVSARLLQDGAEVDTFDASRTTTQGGYGTCDMLRRISAALGKDIAGWLKTVPAPTPEGG